MLCLSGFELYSRWVLLNFAHFLCQTELARYRWKPPYPPTLLIHRRSQHDSRQWRYCCIGYKFQPYSWVYILAHLQDSEFQEHTRHKRLSHIVCIDILLPFSIGKHSPCFHLGKTRTQCHVMSVILADVSGKLSQVEKVTSVGCDW